MAATNAAPFEQPLSFDFDAESEAEIEKVLKRYPPERKASGVIPLLWIAQRQMGRRTHSAWVPVKAMDLIAERLGMAPIRVYEVATFYLMFNMRPIGKYHLQLCTTTPCWLCGSAGVVEACEKALGVHVGESTKDGMFTLMEVECLGACANAPMVQINDDYYEDLTADSMTAIIDSLKKDVMPPAGPQNGRTKAMGVKGPTSLHEQAKKAGAA